MSGTAIAYLTASSLYLGFQWTIRVLVYPQFARAGAEGFATYEAQHQRLVSIAVGPLFAGVGLTSLAVLAYPPADVPRLEAAIAPALVALLLGITAVLAVPLHGRLSEGYDARTHATLLRVDTARLVVAAASLVVGLVLTVQAD